MKDRSKNSRKGNGMVEFALASVVITALTIGGVDFARLFVDATSMVNAAAAGTQYATYASIAVGKVTDATTAASAALKDTSSAAVASGVLCYCGNTLVADCETNHCTSTNSAYPDLNQMYIRTTITKNFETMVDYPLIPKSIPIKQTVWMRVR